MNRWFTAAAVTIAALLLGVVFLRGQPAGQTAESKKEKRTITTAGSATIKIKPDSARVFFGVQSIAPSIKEARQDNSIAVKKVMEALKGLQITDLKMKTSNVNVELVQSVRNEAQLPAILGYRLTNTFTVLVKSDDPQKLSANAGKILDTALENGANIVQQIVFFKEDDLQTRRQALTRAVEAATENAEALAKGAKVRIADTLTIDGQPEYSVGYQQGLSNTLAPAAPAGAETPLVAGDLEITCRVNVTCTY
jgi:uncharacterized protein YggE